MTHLETWRQVFRAAALKLELASVDLDENGNCSIVSADSAIPNVNIDPYNRSLSISSDILLKGGGIVMEKAV